MTGWCGSCIPEARAWSELYPSYKGKGLDLLIVSVDPNDTRKTIKGFREAGNIGPLPWAIDQTGQFTRSLDVPPSTRPSLSVGTARSSTTTRPPPANRP